MKPLTAVTVWMSCAAAAHAGDLPRSAPETQGLASSAVLAFVEAADSSVDSLHSLMIVRHGQVVAEGWWAPYDADSRHSLYSLSKSFTATAIGIAIAEGKLSLDDPVLKFFPDDAPANPSPNLQGMRISDLLRMSTGHQSEPPRTANESWAKTFLAHPVPFKPGTHFLYNTSATYMLSAIIQQATGETLLDYLTPRLFQPLGIDEPTWEVSPQGVSTGGYGLSVRTGDIARFGQLCLQNGSWEGRQLVPAEWITRATSLQTSNGSNPHSDWDQGYGYQFWRCRHDGYRGDGAFGQFCIVLPEQDAVIAITSGTADMPAVLNLVWKHLLPAFQSEPLPDDAASQARLRERLAALSLPPVEQTASPATTSSRRYEFPENDSKLQAVVLEPSPDGAATTVRIITAGTEAKLNCLPGVWTRDRIAYGQFPEQPLAISGGWTAGNTLTIKMCFIETPFVVTLRLEREGEELRYASETNVGFGPTKRPVLTGR
ncbi:MAG: serine hydrolase [Planctomyces sp.]|nr:serine hydrolase [Planctomyces sp.]